MVCPICGASALVAETRNLPYSYKGHSFTIKDVRGEFCSSCDEVILDGAESERINNVMLAFNKQVNSTFVDPQFISKVRKKLALDQREASDLFGGGVNAFSRYEKGKAKPPLSLIQLFKILDNHPDLLAEVKAA